MFWGLELEPSKKYKQVVEKSFHISMACLQPSKANDSSYVSFVLTKDSTDFLLCNLQKEKLVQVALDLNFNAGDEITFQTKGGKNSIHLSGYLIEDDMMEEEDQSGWMESESEDDEIPQLISSNIAKKIDIKRKGDLEPLSVAPKVAKVQVKEIDSSDDDLEMEEEEDEDDEDDDDDSEDDESDDEGQVDIALEPAKSPSNKDKNKNKSPKKQSTPASLTNGKAPKENKNGQGSPAVNAATPKLVKTPGASTPTIVKTPGTPGTGTPSKQTLAGGVIIEDTKKGAGVVAKSGKVIQVYYTGRLKANGKVFDSTTKGPGFKFRLGGGEVIKGWDVGVVGMRVGGKRTITIPPGFAYGSKGAPPQIPPNSTLSFDVELKTVS